jgi:hypothetical protein
MSSIYNRIYQVSIINSMMIMSNNQDTIIDQLDLCTLSLFLANAIYMHRAFFSGTVSTLSC